MVEGVRTIVQTIKDNPYSPDSRTITTTEPFLPGPPPVEHESGAQRRRVWLWWLLAVIVSAEAFLLLGGWHL